MTPRARFALLSVRAVAIGAATSAVIDGFGARNVVFIAAVNLAFMVTDELAGRSLEETP